MAIKMYKEIMRFVKKNREFLFIAIFLLILPFFWFKKGNVDFGGDSSRLYFYAPYDWFKNIAFPSVNSLTGFGNTVILISAWLITGTPAFTCA